METSVQVTASSQDGRKQAVDQLVKIDGIAAKTAEAMVEMGIHDYADLVQYLDEHSTQDVSEALREHGVNRSPGFIDREAWVGQAQELAKVSPKRAKGVGARSTELAPDTGEQAAGAQGEVESAYGTPLGALLSRSGQVSHASLDQEAGQLEASSFDGEQIVIDHVQLSLVGPTSDFPEQRLRAEVTFCLLGSDACALTSRELSFRIEAYVLDTDSGDLKLVASERGQLVPNILEYHGRLEFVLPEIGRYDFYVVVLLLPPGHMSAYRQGPTINIVP
jgi:hypothetical protein